VNKKELLGNRNEKSSSSICVFPCLYIYHVFISFFFQCSSYMSTIFLSIAVIHHCSSFLSWIHLPSSTSTTKFNSIENDLEYFLPVHISTRSITSGQHISITVQLIPVDIMRVRVEFSQLVTLATLPLGARWTLVC